MAKSTFKELVNRTIQECGISGGDVASVTGQTGIRLKAVTWVAEADLYIQRLFRDWNFLHTSHSDTTINNTKDYTKPTSHGLWDVDSFYLDYTTADYVALRQYSYEEWRSKLGAGVQSTNTPSYFIIKPNKDIILYPTPDAAYALTADYWKLPTKLSDNTDTSDIPEHFEDIIVHRAKILYAQHEEAADMLQVARQEYELALMDLKANEAPGHSGMNLATVDATVQVF